MNIKKHLKREIWRSESYYLIAKKGSLDFNHPGMKILKKYSHGVKNILDLGCGEGTRLNFLSEDKEEAIGIDISKTAIKLAKKNYPKLKFISADLEDIPIRDNSFELVYSAYVLEHLTNPEKVLLEAIRLTNYGGFLIFIAPNYGSPNRCSPSFKGSRIKKFIKGLFGDLKIGKSKQLNWLKVTPIASYDKYDIDWDTTVEPYLGSLLFFLKDKGLKIKEFTSCWSEELPNATFLQKIFRLLGGMKIYPFNRWGPHLVITAQKK